MSRTKTLDVLKGFFVYVLFSIKDKKFYVGFTHNLDQRLKEHFSGNVDSTRSRRPFQLIHYEYFVSENDAIRREVYLKGGNGKSALKIQLKEMLRELRKENPVGV